MIALVRLGKNALPVIVFCWTCKLSLRPGLLVSKHLSLTTRGTYTAHEYEKSSRDRRLASLSEVIRFLGLSKRVLLLVVLSMLHLPVC